LALVADQLPNLFIDGTTTAANTKSNLDTTQEVPVATAGAVRKRVEAEDNDSSEEDDGNYCSDDNEETDEQVDEKDIDDNSVNDLADELHRLDVVDEGSTETTNDLMKPLIYAWFDEDGRQHLTLDFLVMCLPEGDFTPRVTRSGMSLELGFTVPEIFFSPTRLTSASDGNITGMHHKHTAFTAAVHDTKASTGGYDMPMVVWQKVKLPFKVELDFCSLDNEGPGFELVAFAHPNKKFRKAGQNLFIFTVELISVVKPRNIKRIIRGKQPFRMVTSPGGESDESEDSSLNL
jgi:hypothetical protein